MDGHFITKEGSKASDLLELMLEIHLMAQETYEFHQDRGDFARWIAHSLNDAFLSELVLLSASKEQTLNILRKHIEDQSPNPDRLRARRSEILSGAEPKSIYSNIRTMYGGPLSDDASADSLHGSLSLHSECEGLALGVFNEGGKDKGMTHPVGMRSKKEMQSFVIEDVTFDEEEKASLDAKVKRADMKTDGQDMMTKLEPKDRKDKIDMMSHTEDKSAIKPQAISSKGADIENLDLDHINEDIKKSRELSKKLNRALSSQSGVMTSLSPTKRYLQFILGIAIGLVIGLMVGVGVWIAL